MEGLFALVAVAVAYVLCGCLFPLAMIGMLVLVIRDTSRKQGRWGINLSPPKACPECGTALPSLRMPTSVGQALFGGWTCSSCGAEIDKWGRTGAPDE